MDAIVTPAPPTASGGQFLTFMLGSELFAIGILAIKEIIEYSALTCVPMMPTCVRGVINLRGAVVPVLDLAMRFGQAPSAPNRRSCVIIIETRVNDQPQVVGMMVDGVNAVLDMDTGAITAPPDFGARIRSEFIAGIGKVSGHFVILLNIESVLLQVANDLRALAEAGAMDAGS